MDLIAANEKEGSGQHVHGWENITSEGVMATAILKSKLAAV